MKLENQLTIAACIASLVISAFAYNAAEGKTLENYEGAGRTYLIPNIQDVGSASEEFYENRRKMGEAVRAIDSRNDSLKIIFHVVEENGVMDEEGLREAGISEEGFNQLMDDANLGF